MPTAAANATGCGRYDCGHVGRSDSRALKRAAFLYLAEVDGQGDLCGREGADVLAALALMREGHPCEFVAQHYSGERTRRPMPSPRPEVTTPVLTPQQSEVLALASEGWAIPEIAEMTNRATETVRSLLAMCRRNTATHSTLDAAVVATRYGII